MSDPSAMPSQSPSIDTTNSRTPTSTSDKAQGFHSSSSRPESPSGAQEISYFSSKPLDTGTTALSEYSRIQNKLAKFPGGTCYTREELFHLRKSPLVAPPASMPPRKDWFGEANEQLSKPRDHDNLTATRMRHRRDHDAEDPSRPSESSRSLFTSGPAQPSQMGSFRLHSFRDRGSDIDKDTASLKSMAERYDRGDRLGPQSPGIAGFTNRVKDRDNAPHFPGSAPRVGQVPRRTETREPRQRKPGDVATDWRKNADPARERSEARNDPARGGREPSRTRPGDDNNNGERKKRDRSHGVEDEPRKWRDDPGAVRKTRDPSATREDKDVNGNARSGRKRGDDEERAEANRKRKEERDKETPAWFDDDVPPSGASKGIVGAKVGDELDELQKWKLEKKAKEEQKEREANTTPALQHDLDDHQPRDLVADTISDEHKTPKPSNTYPDLPSSAPPLPNNPTVPQANGNALEHLKALMGIPNGDSKEFVDDGALEPSSGVSSNEPSLQLPAFFTTPSTGTRPTQASPAIDYEVTAKVSAEELRRNIPDYDAPIMSRHAFAQPRASASPTAANTTSFGMPIKNIDGASPINQTAIVAPPGLRPLQSAEPSHRTRNVGEMQGASLASRTLQNASPAQSLSGVNTVNPSFGNRQPPPHMNSTDHAPLLHLPASAGAGAGPKDGSLNVLSVLAPQPHAPSVNPGAVGGTGVISRLQNASPQQNLLSRLGILNPNERKGSPKNMDTGYDRVPNTDLRMPLPQQYPGSGPPSAISRDSYGSPANERFETHSASGDVRYGMGHASNSSTSSFGPSPVGGVNPTSNLAAKGSRLAKFFDHTRGEEMVSPNAMHGSVMGGIPPNGLQERSGLVTPPQYDNKSQGATDLLALLQGASLHGPQQVNRIPNGPEQVNYRDELAMHRQRELALQQQQIREREARQLEQQLYSLNHDIYDSRGSFVSNDLVPGLRPPIQRQDRDPYASERLDERLNYAAHGRIPGVPGGYDQMMRAMSAAAPTRGNPMMYPGVVPGQGGISNQYANELLQQQQLQQRERQRQAQQRQELERVQLLAMQANGLGPRAQGSNILPQIAARQNNADLYSRGGRLPGNEIQSPPLGGYPGFAGNGINTNGSGIGGMNVNGGFGGLNAGNPQLGGFDNPLRQQQATLQQRQGNLGMGFSGIGGIDSRYGQQPPLHGGQMPNQGNAQANDLMALLLAGNLGNHQN